MKITLDLENLQGVIEEVAKKQTGEAIEDAIRSVATSFINANYKDKIEQITNEILEQSIRDYIDKTEIPIGTGLGCEPIMMTPRQYINSTIEKTFQDKTFTIKVEGTYRTEERKIGFDDFIKSELNPTTQIQAAMKDFARDTKSEINRLIKDTYNSELSKAVGASVVDVIFESEQFKRINNNIKRLSED